MWSRVCASKVATFLPSTYTVAAVWGANPAAQPVISQRRLARQRPDSNCAYSGNIGRLLRRTVRDAGPLEANFRKLWKKGDAFVAKLVRDRVGGLVKELRDNLPSSALLIPT